MKNKFLIIVVALGAIAIAIIYYANNIKTVNVSDPLITSKTMEKSVAGCKNAAISIDNSNFKLENEIATSKDEKSNNSPSTLRFANQAAKGLIDSGPVYDLACAYELSSAQNEKTIYLSVLLGLTKNEFATLGSLLLGENITLRNVKIENNKVFVSYIDQSGSSINKTITIDGDTLIFARENQINDNIIE